MTNLAIQETKAASSPTSVTDRSRELTFSTKLRLSGSVITCFWYWADLEQEAHPWSMFWLVKRTASISIAAQRSAIQVGSCCFHEENPLPGAGSHPEYMNPHGHGECLYQAESNLHYPLPTLMQTAGFAAKVSLLRTMSRKEPQLASQMSWKRLLPVHKTLTEAHDTIIGKEIV